MSSFRRLRVLHLTVSDYGGAGVACLRLHDALQKLGVESRVFVRKRIGEDRSIVQTDSKFGAAMRFRLDRLPLRLYPRKRVFAWWSVNWLRGAPALKFSEWDPDIIHVHWIGDGFVPIEWLGEIRKPIVWTMHDMWPFTGGCHYAWTCERYEAGCGQCPQLGSTRHRDLSSYSAARKTMAWNSLHGVAVAPSPWLAEAARRSSVMQRSRVEVIPNGLDGMKFKPEHSADARRRLDLPDDERILLTGAVGAVKDERKGFSLLVDALRACRTVGKTMKWRLLVFGANTGPGEDVVGIPVSYCGSVADEHALARIYQAADVYVLPSLQDNLPNTVVEALACGKPVVGFRAGGLATMVTDDRTGWLAEPFSTASLSAALVKAMESTSEENSAACRAEFERVYAWPGPAEKYVRLYEEMLMSSTVAIPQR